MNKIIYLTLSIIALILLLLYMLGIIGTAKVAPGTTELGVKTPPKDVRTTKVKKKLIDDILSWPGTLHSRTEALIAPRVTARIIEIKVQAGDSVQKGDVIALLDPKAQRARERAAYAALSAAKANADRVKADARRIKNLYDQEAATRQMYDQVMAQARVAEAQVKAAASALKETKIGFQDTVLKAPFNGIVIRRLKQPGDMGIAGVPVVAMHNSAALRLEAAIPVSCGRFINLGDKVPVRIENIEQNFTAEIDEIVPEVDPSTRTILVKAILPVSKDLRPGLFGWLDQACSRHLAFLVPVSAVHKIGQLESVKIVADDRMLTRLVRTGKRHQGNVEIQSGLNEGETVIIR